MDDLTSRMLDYMGVWVWFKVWMDQLSREGRPTHDLGVWALCS